MTSLIQSDARDAALRQLTSAAPVVLIEPATDGRPCTEIVLAAEHASSAGVALMVRHGSGFLRVALRDADADRLNLPVMYPPGNRRHRWRDCVTVDARDGTTTGISALDRARTINLLASPTSIPSEFTRPGHIVPVRVGGPADAGRDAPGSLAWLLDLMESAGLRPALACCALISRDCPTVLAPAWEARLIANDFLLPILDSEHDCYG